MSVNIDKYRAVKLKLIRPRYEEASGWVAAPRSSGCPHYYGNPRTEDDDAFETEAAAQLFAEFLNDVRDDAKRETLDAIKDMLR